MRFKCRYQVAYWGLCSDFYFGYSGTDRLESELASELENGRLVRLLCKFGFINERPECVRLPFTTRRVDQLCR